VHVEREPRGRVTRDESVEPFPAGDHDEAAGRAGEQRSGLVGAADVVEHDQHPPAGEQRPIHADRLIELDRGLFGGDAERVQHLRECLDRAHRPVPRVPA
jgi:hypothetical protein